ncbi:hypothetical protein A3C21_01765 [Candidatus Kaiserbacteria bacterium RIFCSPHIGHO2_02_FULL_59_21]|uniref:Indole-3-glycerol phosphate synthase n=2 Tax=Candidatus Kaiseribacteriota TaxID=1752734 RepID=A0A0G2BPL9_9BACT|nr:MAG: Indole-3-glycerol phosphate synthase [Candidatus Kaiserbacteria bacterium GW2011_GWA2_58_9]OGG61612.1 MAG: hypothetical protein A2766_02935 [Candidatus Kaiserbacteria bacterium RIFCSPHIGHO2_01_FULL_58_22]OGG66858.1 MAG: hypothetical protein A3C21_01765 [Candidatus Kaiserbacteria bacterium RIFCSPHIGHO2_02_FULL_59_21]OGG80745.1 MAG: hypothetical protein A2952_01640 [Candidatus Kaiserbacteria bacterium RIFCSPLOWO2_01_FULL_59_34]OGG86220.1 MAG: hypothetical protein A3I47_03225 [Candidatus K
MSILDEIVENKRREIEAAKATRPLSRLKEEAGSRVVARRPFGRLFNTQRVLIAEIKPKSPSGGTLIGRSSIDDVQGKLLETADLYAKSGADAISVLTDEKYFGGSLTLLQEVRARVPQAILRKDFILDEYQVYESLLAGADAYLLIAAILPSEELRRLQGLGTSLGMDCLVEVHDEDDLAEALGMDAAIIGINNRDLRTLETNVAVTERLMRHIPQGNFVVSESGIETAEEVRRVRALGIRGILVGTSILRSPDPLEKIKELKDALHG